jgi:HD-GYP domain-containing protein (c-di-GMP phosphodiesterase class II)
LGVFSDIINRVSLEELSRATAKPVLQTEPDYPTLNSLVVVASKAMDLLEGKQTRSALKTGVIAGSIAKMMGLSNRDVASVVYAALLHDIGLARLVSEIYPHLPADYSEKQLFQDHALLNARVISQPAALSASSTLQHLLQQHPLYTKVFLEDVNLSYDVISLIEAHHELCDGSGYPFGLTGDQIPLGAKILAFADVIESILETIIKDSSSLVSRKHALQSFMDIKAPGKFDTEVVQVFSSLIESNEEFLRLLHTLELENMLKALLPEREALLSGEDLLTFLSTLGELSDSTMVLYKQGRSRTVARLAANLANEIEIPKKQQGELYLAGLIMDVGHLATPAALLMKTEALTLEERLIIQNHPLHTVEIFKGLPGLDNAVLWASEHHERLNGKGYPGQKKGPEISIGGRLLALADVFEALTTKRPFRNYCFEPMDALPVMGQGRQTLYDSELVNVLKTVIFNQTLPTAF